MAGWDESEAKPVGWITSWKAQLKQLKNQVYVIYLALQDRRTPWYAKCLAAIVVGYAFSPLDLIPDFIPVLGYLDDLILIPVGVAWVLKLIPKEVMLACKEQALAEPEGVKPKNWIAAGIIILVWIATAVYLIKLLWVLPWAS